MPSSKSSKSFKSTKSSPISPPLKDSSVEGLLAFIEKFAHRDYLHSPSFAKNLKKYVETHQPDLCTQGQNGHTPLTLLAEMDKKNQIFSRDVFNDSVFFLLEKGANPHQTTKEGLHFLSFIWSKKRKNFGFIEKYLDQGYSLGEFDLDSGDGIQDLLSNLLLPEFRRLEHRDFSKEHVLPSVWERVEFYLNLLEKKREMGEKIETNPYMVFSRFTAAYTTQKERLFLHDHLSQFQDWFKICQNKGFDINPPDSDGKTVIHHAIQIRSKPYLEEFFKMGAHLFPDFYGTPIESYAFSSQFYDYAEWAHAKAEQSRLQALPLALTPSRTKKL